MIENKYLILCDKSGMFCRKTDHFSTKVQMCARAGGTIMGHVYRSLKPVPVPPDGSCNQHDRAVSRYYTDNKGHRRRTVIGYMAEPGMMFPNDKFRELYPDLWTEYYGDNIPEQRLVRTGLYAFSLGAGSKTSLYPALAESLGAGDANALMDFAMYSIQEDKKSPMPVAMGKYMLFSAMRMTEAWYREFFAGRLSPVLTRLFRAGWLKLLQKEHGLESVWLCSGTADLGSAAGSGGVSGCISYVWAADARDGRPVSYFVCNGAFPSRTDLDEIASFMGSCNVSVKGVILDSRHASREVLKDITDSGLEYVVRLAQDACAYADMHARHARDIYWNVSRQVDDAVFGIAGKCRLFPSSEEESCTGLFFSGGPGMQHGQELVARVRSCAAQLQQRLARNSEKASVPDEFRQYLSLERDDKGVMQVVFNEANCRKVLENDGYFALASGSQLSAGELYARYRLYLASERQFSAFRDMLLKDALGLFSCRMYSEKAAENFFLAALVAAVIRTEMDLACRTLQKEDIGQEPGKDSHDDDNDDDAGDVFRTNGGQEYGRGQDILHELDRICMIRMASGCYQYIDRPGPEAERLLACFGITRKHLDAFAAQKICQDPDSCSEERRAIPGLMPAGCGRPKGSKNKKTLEKERSLREALARGEEPQEKRSPGRPKGSKNKKTLEKERQLQDALARGEEPAEKRGRGRPKGAKNKKTLERERRQQEALGKESYVPAPSRGPGRPKGSKNKVRIS